MKLAYLTTSFPYGNGESFVEPEIEYFLNENKIFFLFPLLGRGELKKYNILKNPNLKLADYKILTFKMMLDFIAFMILNPLKFFYLLKTIFKSKPKHLFKNFIVFPKAVYISKIISKNNITHLHVHWSSTTATTGLIAAEIAGIKWSITCHRWDIYDKNLLKIKSEKAEFVRFISERGKNDAVKFGVLANKATIIHMGVKIPLNINIENYVLNSTFNIICPANLIDVKGHTYLIKAVNELVKRGFKIKLFIAGDGELRDQLIKEVKDFNLENIVQFLGHLMHLELLNFYTSKQIHCVLLPSIELGNGLHEGIPVSLMEGMAYGKLVISTKTGSISELLYDDLNVTIEEKDFLKLANLLQLYIENPIIYNQKCIELNELIKREWDIKIIMNKLSLLFK